MAQLRLQILCGMLVGALSVCVRADFNIGGVDYHPQGPSETLTATFTVNDGGVTVNQYSGLVQIKVTGFGEALATRLNDAFYIFTDLNHNPVAPVNDASFYQLAFDVVPLVGQLGDPTDPALNARNHIVYDVDADVEVAPVYVPAYNAGHEYNFVLDTGSVNPTNLHFGISNGNFGDNSGAYTIEIEQLIPSPGAAALALLGLPLVIRRRRSI